MKKYGLLKLSNFPVVGLTTLWALWTTASQGMTTDQWDKALQIHGFLTQGYVNTTANSFFGDSEDGSLNFREIGINASYRFNPEVMVSAQLLSRTAGEMYDGTLGLDYGQIDFTPYSTPEGRFGTILGRFKNPIGFYNDTRDVASTRTSIFVPQVIYWDRVRNMVLSSDGAMFYGDLQERLHGFYFHLFSGRTPIDENVEKTYLPAQLEPSMEQQGLTKGGRLLYEWDGGVFRLGLSGAKLNLDGKMAGGLLSGSIDIDFWIASAQFNHGPWSLTFEYMNEPVNYNGFNDLMEPADTTADGYYLQGNYRLTSDWEILLRYEEAHYNKDDRDGSDINIPGTEPHNFYSRMWTFGLLWEPLENLMLRAEYSRTDGTLFLSNLENPDPQATERKWNMLSLLISYSF